MERFTTTIEHVVLHCDCSLLDGFEVPSCAPHFTFLTTKLVFSSFQFDFDFDLLLAPFFSLLASLSSCLLTAAAVDDVHKIRAAR